jgi:hypothetical protein
MAAAAVGFAQPQLDKGVTVPFPGTIQTELNDAIERRRITAHGVVAKRVENEFNSQLQDPLLQTVNHTYTDLDYINVRLSAMNGIVQRTIDGGISFHDLHANRGTDVNAMNAFLNTIDDVFEEFGRTYQVALQYGPYAFQRNNTGHNYYSQFFNEAVLVNIVAAIANTDFSIYAYPEDGVFIYGLANIIVGAIAGQDEPARLKAANINTKLRYLSVKGVDLTRNNREALATNSITQANVADMTNQLDAFILSFTFTAPVRDFDTFQLHKSDLQEDQELKVICACVAFHSVDQDAARMLAFVQATYKITVMLNPILPAYPEDEDTITSNLLGGTTKHWDYPYIPIAISIEEHDGRINAATAITNSLPMTAATSLANDTPFPNRYDVNAVPAPLAGNAPNRTKLAHFRQTKDYDYRAQEYLVDVELTLKQFVPRSNPEDEYGYVEGAIDYSFSSDAKTETVFKRGITVDFTTLDNFNGHFANNFAEINHIYDYLANIQGPLGRKNETITLRKSTKPTALFKVTKDAANALLTDPAAPQPDLQAVLAVEGKVIEDANGDDAKFQFLMQNIDYSKLVQFADVSLLVDQILAQRRGILTEAIFKLRADQARLASLLYFTDKKAVYDALLTVASYDDQGDVEHDIAAEYLQASFNAGGVPVGVTDDGNGVVNFTVNNYKLFNPANRLD